MYIYTLYLPYTHIQYIIQCNSEPNISLDEFPISMPWKNGHGQAEPPSWCAAQQPECPALRKRSVGRWTVSNMERSGKENMGKIMLKHSSYE